MTEWQPIDYHGIVTLNRSVINELQEYLKLKESQLAATIAHAVHPSGSVQLPPILEPAASVPMTLSQGIDALQTRIKQCDQASELQLSPGEWRDAVGQVDQGFWNYVELLEGVVTEFFQQLDQIGFERWGGDLIEVVEAIKVMITQKFRETSGAIAQVEALLKSFRRLCQRSVGAVGKLKGIFPFHQVDKDIRRNIVKADKFLGFRYQTFMHRVEQYEQLKQSTEQSTKKFDTYLVFSHYDKEQREIYVHLYQWMRIWELNLTTKSLPEREPVRAIRRLQAPDKLLHFFKEYEKALREALFNRSRMIKMHPNSLTDLISKIQHQHALQGQMSELHTLGSIVRKYRDFLLRTDPNPYIRSRLGFGEWIVGPEPAIAKNLMELIYQIESLDELFKQLMASVEQGDIPLAELNQLKADVQRTLHEMAQPLASYSLMKAKGGQFVHAIQKINELGSTHEEIVDFIGDALSKALRIDWKFHVLHEIPAFHQIYGIHQGIVGPLEDRSHHNRMHRFKRLIQEIQEWVKNNDIHKHVDEIEFDISDLKGYLQDFLAYVQRLAKEKETENPLKFALQLKEVSNQLLEYRYLFGHFFHHLRRDKAEERVIRNQFLFVDQYFETVENKLYDLHQEA